MDVEIKVAFVIPIHRTYKSVSNYTPPLSQTAPGLPFVQDAAPALDVALFHFECLAAFQPSSLLELVYICGNTFPKLGSYC